MNKKKVTFIMSSAYDNGGIEKAVSNLTKSLVQHNDMSITVISIFKRYSEFKYFYGDEIKFLSIFNKPVNIKFNFLRVKKELNKTLKEVSSDLYIVEGLGLLPLINKKFMNKTIVRDHVGVSNFKKFGLSWWGSKFAYKHAMHLVTVNLSDLKKHNKLDNKQILPKTCIYNPVTLEPFKNCYKNKSKQFISVGRLTKVKGFHKLIERLLFLKDTEWKYHIYGDGPLKEKIEKKINMLGLSNNIILKGFHPNIQSLYSNYSFFVLPSSAESFGIVLVEALISGIPLIAFDCPDGPREIVFNNKNGFLVENQNFDLMISKIKLLIEDEQLRETLALNSHYKLHRFSDSSINKNWYKLITTSV
jgi:glycosyltransferase involved in cell wall biosynthesis